MKNRFFPCPDQLKYTVIGQRLLTRPSSQPCMETEEFNLLQKMLNAIGEERYKDAAEVKVKLSHLIQNGIAPSYKTLILNKESTTMTTTATGISDETTTGVSEDYTTPSLPRDSGLEAIQCGNASPGIQVPQDADGHWRDWIPSYRLVENGLGTLQGSHLSSNF
ncbi:hypothetical protein RHSIM_Rhsim02G0191900 [Rhododendron simsii]|uniref:Uncharacterized protein n=1 Tax=Rhododendron simsii TaxID=118357 RepID=A0A834HPP7_RHOSS|nr:hypothetical protein RHSIM_Rhsim02G0191900 [Rhododendron simsii]